MLSFKQYLTEQLTGGNEAPIHVVLMLHPTKPPTIHYIKKNEDGESLISEEILDERQYAPKEHKHIDNDEGHKMLGEFKPSKLDHHTITKEFHEHLHKHGYYSFAPAHPLVLSPHEQKFKSEFKRKVTGRTPKHEAPHRDGGFGGKGMGYVGRHVALWSTQGSTHIFNDKGERIHHATKDGHVTVIDDSKVKHASSGHHDRWFVRAHEIKKIPKHHGLMIPTPNGGNPKKFGHDIEAYHKAKKKSVGGPVRDVAEFDRKHRQAGTAGTGIHKEVMDWVKEHHPQFHPDYKHEHEKD
jgi:hypothetical protein